MASTSAALSVKLALPVGDALDAVLLCAIRDFTWLDPSGFRTLALPVSDFLISSGVTSQLEAVELPQERTIINHIHSMNQ
jgi:hypothetical protein